MYFSSSKLIDTAIIELNEFFKGERKSFDISILASDTEFQKLVWSELCNIPYGHLISYKGLSEFIGRISAIRTVANAVGANMIPILMSCHRVVCSNNAMIGYRGEIKSK